jgi:nitrogen-specific signal transduction histidine kinase
MEKTTTSHADNTLSKLVLHLRQACLDEKLAAERLEAIDADLALHRARWDAASTLSDSRRRASMQHISALLELRSSLLTERLRRRCRIDELAQRKEAITAAIAVLRKQFSA